MKDVIEEVAKFQTLIELYKSKAVTEFDKALVRTMEQINSKLLDFPSNFQRSQLNTLKREIAYLIKEQYEPLIDNLLSDNLDIANMAYGVYASSLTDDFKAIPKYAIESILDPNRHILGQTLKEITIGLQEKQISKYKQVIADGMINGASTAVMSKTLRDYNDGSLRHHINAISRTAFQSAMQEAYNVAMVQHDEFIGYAFSHGVLDSRTSPICQEQTGKSVKRREGESITGFRSRASSKLIATPRHVNCRSHILYESATAFKNRGKEDRPAVVGGDKKTVKHRDGSTSTVYKNKQVEMYKQDVTYDEFFSQQSPAFQKSVLGAKKYDLYKEGRLSISSIRDIKSNRFLTNEEIMNLF